MTEYPADGVCGGMATADGAIWFISDHNAPQPKIGRFDPSTHAVVEYPVPTAKSNPDTLTAGPDGALWFAEFNANKIGRLDLSAYTFTEYNAPGAGFMTNGPQNSLWFTAPFTNKIGQVAPYSAPVAPTKVTAAATGVGQATVNFTVPCSKRRELHRNVQSRGGNDTNAGSTSSPHIVTNLQNGAGYTFTVTAANSKGMTSPSKASNKITTWADPGTPKITSLRLATRRLRCHLAIERLTPATRFLHRYGRGNGSIHTNRVGIKKPVNCDKPDQ